MRQTFTLAVGGSLVGAQLPDGSGAVAAQVDNPSGTWYQLYPGGGTVAPYTQGATLAFPGGAPAVDVRAMVQGPAGQPSLALGAAPVVTLFDDADAPPADAGTPISTPSSGLGRYVGSLAGSGTLPVALLTGERSILVVVPSNALAATTVAIETASGIATRLSTFFVSANPTPGVTIGYANPAIATAWQVVTTADPTQRVYVFADTGLNTVAIASDPSQPVYAQVANNGPLGGGNTPLYVHSVHGNTDLIGQQVMGGSLPVVLASDQSVAGTIMKQMLGGAVNLAANTATSSSGFAATAGVTQIYGFHATAILRGTALGAAEAFGYIEVVDGSANVWRLTAIAANEGDEASVIEHFPVPVRPSNLVTGNWTLRMTNSAVVGTAGMDVVAGLVYGP